MRKATRGVLIGAGALFALLGLLMLAPVVLLSVPEVAVPSRTTLVLDEVTVINPGLSRASGRSVSIDNDRIAAVGEATKGTANNPYRGMFVLPGLIDMHTHYPNKMLVGLRESASLMHLASGVTTIRDTGTTNNDPADTRRRIVSGQFPGPRIFMCGPVIDGDPPTHPLTTPVATPEAARELVDSLAAQGDVSCIKVYTRISHETLSAVREAATRHKLPLIGHVPATMSLAQSQLDDSQHLYGIGEKRPMQSFGDSWGAWEAVDEARMAEIIKVSLEKKIAHTPTLVVFEKLSRIPELAADPTAVPRSLPAVFAEVMWHPQKGAPAVFQLQPAHYASVKAAMPRMRRMVGEMHRAGVELHLGTDVFMPHVVPGRALIEEMEQFVAAGIPLEDVWALGTRKAGESLGLPLLGSVAAGAPADLLVFREDPTLDLKAMDTLELVVADGRAYTRADIDAALARHTQFAQSKRYRTIMQPMISAIYALLPRGSE